MLGFIECEVIDEHLDLAGLGEAGRPGGHDDQPTSGQDDVPGLGPRLVLGATAAELHRRVGRLERPRTVVVVLLSPNDMHHGVDER